MSFTPLDGMRLITYLTLLCCALLVESRAAGVVSQFGRPFTPDLDKVEHNIPRRGFASLPEEVGVYTVANNRPLRKEGVKWVIQSSALTKEQKNGLLQKLESEPATLTGGRTVLLRDGQTNFVISPQEGLIALRIPASDKISDLMPTTETKEDLLATSEFRDALSNLLAALGWDDREIQRKPNGEYKMQASDRNRYPNRQKDPVLVERSIILYRQVSDYPVASTAPFQIKMTRVANGKWREFFIYWPELRIEKMIPTDMKSEDALRRALDSKGLIWDHNNNLGPTDVERIAITAVRLVYFHAEGTGLEPALVLDATLHGRDETEDGVLFLPLL